MNKQEKRIKSKMLNYMVEQELKIDKLERKIKRLENTIKSVNDVDKCLEHLNN